MMNTAQWLLKHVYSILHYNMRNALLQKPSRGVVINIEPNENGSEKSKNMHTALSPRRAPSLFTAAWSMGAEAV